MKQRPHIVGPGNTVGYAPLSSQDSSERPSAPSTPLCAFSYVLMVRPCGVLVLRTAGREGTMP